MNEQKRKAGLDRMRAYIAQLQPLMRLQQWDIRVIDEEPSDGCLADCGCFQHEHMADFRLADHFFANSPDRQRNTIVHEMLHVAVEGWWRSTVNTTEGLNSIAQIWAMERNTYQMEMTVDHLSRIIAPFLPLPPAEASQGAA